MISPKVVLGIRSRKTAPRLEPKAANWANYPRSSLEPQTRQTLTLSFLQLHRSNVTTLPIALAIFPNLLYTMMVKPAASMYYKTMTQSVDKRAWDSSLRSVFSIVHLRTIYFTLLFYPGLGPAAVNYWQSYEVII